MVGADSSKFTQAGFHDVFIVVLGLLVLIFHTFKLQFVPKSTNGEFYSPVESTSILSPGSQ